MKGLLVKPPWIDLILRGVKTWELHGSRSATGPGGDINISSDQINLTSGTISATSTGTAEAIAGNITIVFGSHLETENSSITTNSLLAEAATSPSRPLARCSISPTAT